VRAPGRAGGGGRAGGTRAAPSLRLKLYRGGIERRRDRAMADPAPGAAGPGPRPRPLTAATYRVNTMTLAANTDAGTVRLRRVYDAIEAEIIRDAGEELKGSSKLVHVSYYDGVTIRRRGEVLKPNGRAKTYGRRMFDNQATAVIRFDDGSNVNVKIFLNGNLQMTGARSLEKGCEAASIVSAFMLEPGKPPPMVYNVRVCLMNADYNMRHRINRQKLYEAVVAEGLCCSYHPSIYPAVKTYFMCRLREQGREGREQGGACPAGCMGARGGCCKKVTVLAFYTGAIIITGAVERQQIDAAFAWVRRIITGTPGVVDAEIGGMERGKSKRARLA
jgi:TATA-box binding protein (TBP) (component of TFIID and TFIIIB)